MVATAADVRTIRIFQGLGRSDVKALARAAEHLEVEPGDRLVSQGAANSRLFCLIGGTVGVWRDGELKAVLGPGDVFGEITMERSGPATATVTVMQRAELLVFDRERYPTLLGIDAAAERVREILALRLNAVAAG